MSLGELATVVPVKDARQHLRPAWRPGQSGNPAGKPRGVKDRPAPRLWVPRYLWLMKKHRRRGLSPAAAEAEAVAELALLMVPAVRVRALAAARGDRWPECRWCGRLLGGDAVPVMIERQRWAHSGCLPTLLLSVMAVARAEVLLKLKRKR